MTINFKLFNQIVQLLTFDKMNQIGLKYGEVIPFTVPDHIESNDGFYKMILGRFFFGLESSVEVDKIIKAGIIVKTGDVYWIDEQEGSDEVLKLDVEVQDGETIYISNGYEVYPKEDEKIYKYQINQEIIDEAHEIYKKLEAFINADSNNFTFTLGVVKYEVPLYATVLINAFNKKENLKIHMLDLSFTDKDFKEMIKQVDDVSILINASSKSENIETINWKETIILNS